MSVPDTSTNVHDVTHGKYTLENTKKKIPEMLPIVPAAKTRGLSSYIVRKWCLSGVIRAVRCGNKILVNCDSLDEYLSSNSLTDAVEEQVSSIKPIPVKIGGAVR
ncbi:MAG: helix-turn-helix domain-containing protein [Ruminococcus sp.]|nr:helix-turn-helix domain-containing protein [Ruminococcus sp.]